MDKELYQIHIRYIPENSNKIEHIYFYVSSDNEPEITLSEMEKVENKHKQGRYKILSGVFK